MFEENAQNKTANEKRHRESEIFPDANRVI
jgi:hypothetical protein